MMKLLQTIMVLENHPKKDQEEKKVGFLDRVPGWQKKS